MREILFRGKRVDSHEWAEGPYPFGTMHSGTVAEDFAPKSVGQYTGLKDKNGVKVFEGDILKFSDYEYLGTGSVEFVSGAFRVNCGIGNDPFIDDAVEMYGGTVIGNIYDSPELIEE